MRPIGLKLLSKGFTIACYCICMLKLVGCSSVNPPDKPLQLTVARDLLVQQRQSPLVQSELKFALNTFKAYDDLVGIWETNLYLSQLNLGNPESITYAARSLEVAQILGLSEVIYPSAVMVFRATHQPNLLDLAKKHAVSEFQKNQLWALTEEFNKIEISTVDTYSSEELAYVLYWQAKACFCEAELSTAYQLFKVSGNSAAIADVLFLRAKIAHASEQHSKAKSFAVRASYILEAIAAELRYAAVQRWMLENGLIR